MTIGPSWVRSRVARTLALTMATFVGLLLLADLMGFDWDQDPDVALAIMIGVAIPALVLPALAVAVSGPPAPMHSLAIMAPEPRAPLQQAHRPRRRRNRRRPRIVAPERCIHCGQNPKRPRRPARIRKPAEHTASPTRRSLAALIAAVSLSHAKPEPSRPARLIRRH